MISIDINPIAFSLGSTPVRWISIMFAAAAAVAVVWAIRAGSKASFPPALKLKLAISGVVGGVVGARVVHVIDEFNFYVAHPSRIFGVEGLATYGAILGAILAIWVVSRVHRFSFASFADALVPGALLAQAVGRIGCTINGCCYGSPTTLPWGLVYTNPNSSAPLGISTQPAVVYELLFELVLFIAVWKLRGKLRPSGSVFLFYLAAYSVGRFFITATRDPNSQGPLFFGWLMSAQIIAAMIAVTTIPLLIARTRWNNVHVN